MKEFIKVGDTITYRPGFGQFPPQEAVVESIEISRYPGEKGGMGASFVPIEIVKANKAIFNLTNGHWCYSDQVVL